jgi:hypothetical protein
MRSSRDLVLATLGIIAAVGALHYWRISRPSQISGTVVEVITGRPVPNVRVRPKFMNGHGEGVFTDSRGRFTLPVSVPSWISGIFVDGPHHAGLFGKILGRESHSFRQGEQDSGVIVPAIPAAELSGKVHDDHGRPIAGCEVELLRPRHVYGPLRLVAANRTVSAGPGGEYRFTRADAGVYYLLADCNGLSIPSRLPVGRQRFPKQQKVWAKMLYPHADNLSDAKPVIAMPGQRIGGLDFRLTRTVGYLVQGRFVWRDGDVPQQLDLYSNDFSATKIDLGLEPNQTTNSRCGWNTYSGDFKCIHMTRGNYRLMMTISPIWIEADRGHRQRENDQGGETVLHVGDTPPKPVVLEMRKLHPLADGGEQKRTIETGWLNIRLSGCGSHEVRQMTYQIWDNTGRPASVVSTPSQGRHAWQRELKPGRYRVSAVCRAYWGWFDNSYLDEVLAATGTPLQVRSGLTTELAVRARGTEEIYSAAVAYLARQRAPKH